jgi:hypothetical protein
MNGFCLAAETLQRIMMWVWAIGTFSLAAVVQIAIALCRRAQAATGPDLHEQLSPELQSRR